MNIPRTSEHYQVPMVCLPTRDPNHKILTFWKYILWILIWKVAIYSLREQSGPCQPPSQKQTLSSLQVPWPLQKLWQRYFASTLISQSVQKSTTMIHRQNHSLVISTVLGNCCSEYLINYPKKNLYLIYSAISKCCSLLVVCINMSLASMCVLNKIECMRAAAFSVSAWRFGFDFGLAAKRVCEKFLFRFRRCERYFGYYIK